MNPRRASGLTPQRVARIAVAFVAGLAAAYGAAWLAVWCFEPPASLQLGHESWNPNVHALGGVPLQHLQWNVHPRYPVFCIPQDEYPPLICQVRPVPGTILDWLDGSGVRSLVGRPEFPITYVETKQISQTKLDWRIEARVEDERPDHRF